MADTARLPRSSFRILVLRHIKDWTFDQLEWEVRGNIAYRAFCRIDAHSVPDAKTMIRLERVLDGPHLRAIFERIVALGIQRRASRGTRARIDTTVVEAPIRHPTDSRLLEDAVRVLSRHIRRIARGGVRLLHPPRDRKRSIQRRARAIAAYPPAEGRQGSARDRAPLSRAHGHRSLGDP